MILQGLVLVAWITTKFHIIHILHSSSRIASCFVSIGTRRQVISLDTNESERLHSGSGSGLVDDPVVSWDTMARLGEILSRGCLVGGKVRELDPSLNHFLGLTGMAEKAFDQIFFTDGVLEDLLHR